MKRLPLLQSSGLVTKWAGNGYDVKEVDVCYTGMGM